MVNISLCVVFQCTPMEAQRLTVFGHIRDQTRHATAAAAQSAAKEPNIYYETHSPVHPTKMWVRSRIDVKAQRKINYFLRKSPASVCLARVELFSLCEC